jgi:cell division protein FtsL
MKAVLISLLVAIVLVSAIQVVLARHEARLLFIEIQALERQRDDLNEEWGRLQLEQSTWTMANRIESLARTELDMQSPPPERFMLVPQ